MVGRCTSPMNIHLKDESLFFGSQEELECPAASARRLPRRAPQWPGVDAALRDDAARAA